MLAVLYYTLQSACYSLHRVVAPPVAPGLRETMCCYVPPSHRLSGELPDLMLSVPTLCYALSKLMLFGQQMLLNQ